jgi:hypothetical protein
MGEMDVMTAPHDDVEAGSARDGLQRARIAPDVGKREIDDRPAPQPAELVCLGDGELQVGEDEVVPKREEVSPQKPELRDLDRALRELSCRLVRRRLVVDRGVHDEMLVREHDAEVVGGDRAEHGRHLRVRHGRRRKALIGQPLALSGEGV